MYRKICSLLLVILVIHGNFSVAALAKKEDNNMTRIEICKDNYNKLFGGEALTKTGSDAEMMAILQKYIFGEVFTVGELDIKTREMITVVSLSTQQTLPQLKAHINAALNVGVSPVELREAIYQCAPFIGFPKTLNAITVLNEVFKERGIQTPLEGTMTVKEQDRFKEGHKIQNELYGDEILQSMKGLPDNMGEDVARMLTEVCFGDFYTRKGLDVKTRELLVLSILVTTGDIQTLKSHIVGNMKVGNDAKIIAAVIIQVMPYAGFPKALAALKTLKQTINE